METTQKKEKKSKCEFYKLHLKNLLIRNIIEISLTIRPRSDSFFYILVSA